MSSNKEKDLADITRHNLRTVWLVLFLMIVFASYASLRWQNESPAFEKAKETADTPAYIRISGEEFLSRGFWINARPPMFPLVLKVFEADKIRVAAFQASFSILAWGSLALALAYSFSNVLRPIAFVLILVLSLDRHISGWDVVMLTESISISLLAIFVATWLWLLKEWKWGKVVLLGLISFVWVFTRDTNGWVLFMIAGVILISVLLFQARKRYLSIALLFGLLFSLSNFSANRGNHWVFPFQNVLAQRVLNDQKAVAFFSDCGMPVTQKLLDMAGGYAGSQDRAFYNDPALESYRIWMNANGKSCYARWLLSRPVRSIQEPWGDLAWLLGFEDVAYFYPQRYQPMWPWYLERVLYPQDALVGLWSFLTLVALIAVWRKSWKKNIAWVIFIVLCLLVYPQIFIVWHGDVPGTNRHALSVSLQFVLSFWVFCLLALEKIYLRFLSKTLYNLTSD
jgi:hypothetical protein